MKSKKPKCVGCGSALHQYNDEGTWYAPWNKHVSWAWCKPRYQGLGVRAHRHQPEPAIVTYIREELG